MSETVDVLYFIGKQRKTTDDQGFHTF